MLAAASVLSGEILVGSLQMKQDKVKVDREAGINVAVLSAGWNRLEPEEGKWSAEAAEKLKKEISGFREAGMLISVDFGLQYPPSWIFKLPNCRYKNQYGDEYVGENPGSNGFNAVFVQANRERIEKYIEQFFKEFGTDFHSVRLGWGYYGELNFPFHRFKSKQDGTEYANCYWAFDDIAQGKKQGLSVGIPACPVPGWRPGEPCPNEEAGKFLEWYLGAMQNFHDWQITTVRKHFSGRLCMMYPSWGIRPGWIEAAVKEGLSGRTSPEINGEIQRGYDFSRFISVIKDAGVIVYCTWIDAKTMPADADSKTNIASWSPIKFLSSLAQEHQPKLDVWGENTGPGTVEQFSITMQRAKDCGLLGLVWAFDPQLHDGAPGHLPLAEFAEKIREWKEILAHESHR